MKKIDTDKLNYSPFIEEEEVILFKEKNTVYSRQKTKEGNAIYYTFKVWKPFSSILFKVDPANYDWMTNEEFVTGDNVFYRSCRWKQIGLTPGVPLNFPVLLREDINRLYSIFKISTEQTIVPIGSSEVFYLLTPDIIPTKFLFKGDSAEEGKKYTHSLLLDGEEKPYEGTFHTEKLIKWSGVCLGDCGQNVLFHTNNEDRWTQVFDKEGNRKNPLSSDMSPLICKKCLEEEATKLFKDLEEQGIGTLTDGEFTIFNPPPQGT